MVPAISYSLRMQALRSTFEPEAVGTKQILFVDFDGAIIRGEPFGGPSTVRVPSLQQTLSTRGFLPSDTNPLIDGILAELSAKFRNLQVFGQNGYYPSTGFPGHFDLEIRNSRDHADPWGLPNVSRLIVGGDTASTGIGGVLGIAESVDVGNFRREETALVGIGEIHTALAGVVQAPAVSRVQVLAKATAMVAAHEAGTFLGPITRKIFSPETSISKSWIPEVTTLVCESVQARTESLEPPTISRLSLDEMCMTLSQHPIAAFRTPQ